MNMVLIMADTTRRDYLGCYGSTWCKTPYLDKFAAEAFISESAWD